ncbi:MAG: cation-transporting P-type ATPase, partial [Clostridia bacterium]|nr:cation-transporting P-type ATPase [Clostridia bacterium]
MQATQKPNLNIPSPQTLTAEELAEALGSDLQAGLTARKAKARLKLHGKNLIQREIEFRAASSFKGQLSGMINLLFLCAMLILFLFSQETVYLLAMGVAFLLMLFGTGAELLASRIMRTQEKYSALAVRVIRDGKEQKVDSRLLVPGDLLLLSVGNLVPADARILEDDG